VALEDWYSNLIFFLRWIHIFAGITWIGHLYFFNFVNVPLQAALPKEVKPTVNPQLLPRALFWFRWGAMVTFLVGWLLLLVKYGHGNLWFDDEGKMTHRAMWILFGGILGTIMWFNVWFIIWPAQKQLIRWLKEGQSPPEMAALAKRALMASRTNTYLSGPMLFGMIAPNNYGAINAVTLVVCIAIGAGVVWAAVKYSPKVDISV
jgi:uncharacterized membrane protein